MLSKNAVSPGSKIVFDVNSVCAFSSSAGDVHSHFVSESHLKIRYAATTAAQTAVSSWEECEWA